MTKILRHSCLCYIKIRSYTIHAWRRILNGLRYTHTPSIHQPQLVVTFMTKVIQLVIYGYYTADGDENYRWKVTVIKLINIHIKYIYIINWDFIFILWNSILHSELMLHWRHNYKPTSYQISYIKHQQNLRMIPPIYRQDTSSLTTNSV